MKIKLYALVNKSIIHYGWRFILWLKFYFLFAMNAARFGKLIRGL